MLDLNKRLTLKMLGVTPLLSMPVFVSASGLGLTGNAESHSTLSELPVSTQSTGMPLQIHIIDTSSPTA